MKFPARPFLLCLVLLAAALVACERTAPSEYSVQATREAENAQPQNTPVASQEPILALSGIGGQAAQSDAELPHETPVPSPFPLPTVDAERAQLIADMQTMNDQLAQARRDLDNQNLAVSANYATAAARNEQIAVIDLTKAVVVAGAAHETTAQMQADNEATLLQVRADEAQAAVTKANAAMVEMAAIVAVFIALILLAVRALARHPLKERAPVVVGGGDYFTRPWVPTAPQSHTTKPLPASDEDMYQFLEYAVTGLPLGENSMVRAGAWKSGKEWRDKRQAIMTYLDIDCYHIKDHKMTPEGIDYWQDWLDEHEAPRPAPEPEVAETTTSEGHEHVNNDHVASGEVAVEPETVDPATRAQFAAPDADNVKHAPLSADKDETK